MLILKRNCFNVSLRHKVFEMSTMTNSYDINEFKNPLFTVDSVLFTVKDDALKVLMVKRAN